VTYKHRCFRRKVRDKRPWLAIISQGILDVRLPKKFKSVFRPSFGVNVGILDNRSSSSCYTFNTEFSLPIRLTTVVPFSGSGTQRPSIRYLYS